MGGTNEDVGFGISVDCFGNTFVTGRTSSTDFPTANPLQSNLLGLSDVFVTELNAAGSQLAYSTYLGGSGSETGRGTAIDSAGNAFVAGYTDSTDFPTTAKAFQKGFGGGLDGFIAKIGQSPAPAGLAYTANISGTKTVSEINISTGMESRSLSDTHLGQGIAVTDDNRYAVLTNSGCGPAFGSCALLMDLNTPPTSGTGSVLGACPINLSQVNFVAITPPLPAKNNCRYAFITTGTNNVKVVNLCNIKDIVPVPLPTGTGSNGVTVANFPGLAHPEVWVTDQSSFTAYIINPVDLTVANTPICPGTPANCSPLPVPSQQQVATASISATEYRTYITDAVGGNKAVWVVKNTISGGQVTSRAAVSPVRFTSPPRCDIGFSFTYGIAVKPDNSMVYVTSPGNPNRIYSITNLGDPMSGGTAGCAPNLDPGYTGETFANPRGIVWLSDGRAYVANADAPKVSIIPADPNQALGRITTSGNPYSVVRTQ